MQLIERVRKSEFIGREFLLWLWFRSETREGRFDLENGSRVELWVDRKLVLQSETDKGVEKVSCSGDNPDLREARFALTKNKAVTEAMIKLTVEDEEWSFLLDSPWLNFRSLKTPKPAPESDRDREGLFYEKYFLIEKAVNTLDAIFASFLAVRISPEWETAELPEILEWIREGT